MKVARPVLKERCPQVIEASTLIKSELLITKAPWKCNSLAVTEGIWTIWLGLSWIFSVKRK